MHIHLHPKFFHPLDLGRPILNEHPLPPAHLPHPLQQTMDNNQTVNVNEPIQNKTKPSHVAFKLITRPIIWFSPQTMQLKDGFTV